MTTPLAPGVFSTLFAQLASQVTVRAGEALEAAAELVEERARQSVSARSHPLRTKTTAARGGPPAMISGTLAQSIGHSAPEAGFDGITIKVGMIAGKTPPYSSRTPSSLYAKYLEIDGAGKSRVKYPFLRDAYEKTAHPAVLATFKAAFSRPWI
jgi:hypothetical protein